MSEQVQCKPVGNVSLWRRFLSRFVGFCSYCGKGYVPCHSKEMNLLLPLPQNGKTCPDGHEGYVDRMELWGGKTRYLFDLVKG